MIHHDSTRPRPPRILCIGLPVRDLVFTIDELPQRGAKISASGYVEIAGGNALNAAIGIARLGARVALAGPMGDASEGASRFIFDRLSEEGVDARGLIHMPGLVTPVSAVFVDPTGERTIVTFRDPALWKVQLAAANALLRDCSAILIESRAADFATALCAEARARDIPVVVDVDRAMSLSEGLLTASSHLIFSSDALQATAGLRSDEEALRKISTITTSFLAATRGPRGTLWLDPAGQFRETPAFPVHTVDTLGAGDIFHGAFAVALTEGQSTPAALNFASAAAALKCSRFGGAFAAPDRAEVEQFLRSGFVARDPSKVDLE